MGDGATGLPSAIQPLEVVQTAKYLVSPMNTASLVLVIPYESHA